MTSIASEEPRSMKSTDTVPPSPHVDQELFERLESVHRNGPTCAESLYTSSPVELDRGTTEKLGYPPGNTFTAVTQVRFEPGELRFTVIPTVSRNDRLEQLPGGAWPAHEHEPIGKQNFSLNQDAETGSQSVELHSERVGVITFEVDPHTRIDDPYMAYKTGKLTSPRVPFTAETPSVLTSLFHHSMEQSPYVTKFRQWQKSSTVDPEEYEDPSAPPSVPEECRDIPGELHL